MPTEQQQLDAAIAALEARRPALGDALIEAALGPLRARRAALSATESAQTLRQVTVLFLDMVGSTALAERLDPEDLHMVIDGLLADCTALVEARRGKVLQYAGDSLLAVFGAERAEEDDAERAVHCGLALLAAGRRHGAAMLRRHGQAGFDVRVGVHSGRVLLGGGVDAEGSIRGMTVNIAARMEQSAPAGSLRISQDCQHLVRGRFELTEQQVAVKGVSAPLRSYLVRRALPRGSGAARRGIEGLATPLVGREAEWAQLVQSMGRLQAHPALQSVLVVGEAGLGKTRLLADFRSWAEAQGAGFECFHARAQPQTRHQPYGLLRDLLAERLGIADGDSMDAARDKVELGLAPWFADHGGAEMACAKAHWLGHLIGLDFSASPHVRALNDDARQLRQRSFEAAAELLRRVSARSGKPVLLMLDDLHWADDGSLDFLDHLQRADADVPMFELALTRPALFERRPDWGGRSASARRIDLAPLDGAASVRLAGALLGRLADVPAALRELLTGGADGNPFYMEELLQMLVDEGAIETHGASWTLHPDKLDGTRVPATLAGVLQARLDSLGTAERRALQQAAVIGPVFWDQALAAVDPEAPAALPALLARALVVAQPEGCAGAGTPPGSASLDGVRTYAFRHHLLHQVALDTMLKRQQREVHARTAAWMADLGGARANDLLGATALHYELAGLHEPACTYYARAAEQAAARFAHEAALDYLGRALTLPGDATDPNHQARRWHLLDLRERTLDIRGEREAQRADITALQALAEAMDDDGRRGEAAWRRCDIALRTSDYLTMDSAAREALALAQRCGDAALELRAQQRLAVARTMLGDTEAGQALAEEGLAAARDQGRRHIEGQFLNALSIVAMRRHDLLASLGIMQQILVLQRTQGNQPSEAIALSNLGIGWLALGRHEEARRHLEESLALYRAVGNRVAEASPLATLARLALWQGDASRALEQAQAALAIAEGVSDRFVMTVALCVIGDAELARDRLNAADQAFGRALALAQAIDAISRHDAAAGLARVALARGALAQAASAVQGLIEQLAGGATLRGADTKNMDIRLTCVRVLLRQGDSRAAVLLERSHTDLMADADAITDPALRESFLSAIPAHREITAAWAADRREL